MENDKFFRLPTLPLVCESADSILKPKKGIEDTYKIIRNRFRKYSLEALVGAALNVLWRDYASPLDDLKSCPWLTLLLVKWAAQDSMVALRGGASFPERILDEMRQLLWELPGQTLRLGPDDNVFLALRSLMHVQAEFQRGTTWSFFRWPALYARRPEGRSRRQFRDAIGVEPDVFMDLTYALYSVILKGTTTMASDPLAICRERYGADVDKIYALFSRDLKSLRHDLQLDRAQRLRGRDELFEFPYLKRFPLLRGPDGRLHCWHKLVFARGVEEIVHLRLSEHFEWEYSNLFGPVFEDYVTELARETGRPLWSEAEHKKFFGDSSPAVEVVFDGDGCNIFVEAKMSLFADDVLVQDREQQAYQKMKRVREAIGQAWKVGKQIREHPELNSRFAQPQDYLFVVVSRELLLGSGDKLKRLMPEGELTYPSDDPAAESRLPFGNVFILSIEDFEAVMGCVRAGMVDLSTLLKMAAEANTRADTARLFFSDFIKEHLKDRPLPTLIQQARDQSEARIMAVFE